MKSLSALPMLGVILAFSSRAAAEPRHVPIEVAPVQTAPAPTVRRPIQTNGITAFVGYYSGKIMFRHGLVRFAELELLVATTRFHPNAPTLEGELDLCSKRCDEPNSVPDIFHVALDDYDKVTGMLKFDLFDELGKYDGTILFKATNKAIVGTIVRMGEDSGKISLSKLE